MILDGKKTRDTLLLKYKDIIESKNLKLCLAIIYVGDDAPSQIYVNNKIKACEKIGISARLIRMDASASEAEVINVINELNLDDTVTGMILQSPVPSQIRLEECIKYISPLKDVDGFTSDNFMKMVKGQRTLKPCTPKGIMKLLETYNIDVEGKNVCIVGRGDLVGKPLFWEMLNKNATVTLCHSKTQDLKNLCLNADIIVSGVGKAHLITEDMIKEGAVVIDAGISVVNGKVVGDVDFENCFEKCFYITPNPGGVGPMTIAMIVDNLIMIGDETYNG